MAGWQKLCEGLKGLRRKVWTQTKILSPNIRYFVANWDLSRFTHFLEIFGQKKCLFRSKTVFLGQEVHYSMVYIAYFTELNLQIWDYAQKRRIWQKFSWPFLPPTKGCQVLSPWSTVYLCLMILGAAPHETVCCWNTDNVTWKWILRAILVDYVERQ